MTAAEPQAILKMSQKPKQMRIQFLDVIRAAAVGFVLVQHVGERTFDKVVMITRDWVQLGQLGVMLFFACSGFIIPVTIARSKSVKNFWTSRFFRIYPLYLASLAIAFFLKKVAIYTYGNLLTKKDWLLNFTMLQNIFKYKNAVELYWTLNLEIIFYIIITVLFILKLSKYPQAISYGYNFALILVAIIKITNGGGYIPVEYFAFAMMFFGSVLYQYHMSEITIMATIANVFTTAIAGALVLYNNFYSYKDASGNGTGDFVTMTTTWVSAVVIFFIVVAVAKKYPNIFAIKPITYIGKISYSIYLMQFAAIVVIFTKVHAGLAILSILSVLATILISVFTYYLIEKPGMDIGKKLIVKQKLKLNKYELK